MVRNVAELVGELGLEDAVPQLAKQLEHEDVRVRKSVALALAKVGSRGAAEPLRTALASYVEPARATRQVVRAGRGTARGSIFAKRNEARRIATAPLRSVRTYGSPKAAHPLVREASRAGAVDRSRRAARPSVRVARACERSPFAKTAAKAPARARRR